ncbi:hypothetical protein M5E89_08765 [Acidaminococcus intestini]|nr:hypothetical protein M5E89_08765 [Acidaminococcus intestini]
MGKMLWCCDIVMLKDRTARRQTVSLSVVGAELIFGHTVREPNCVGSVL